MNPKRPAPTLDDARGVIVPFERGREAGARRGEAEPGRASLPGGGRFLIVPFDRATPEVLRGPSPEKLRRARLLGWMAIGSVGMLWLVTLLNWVALALTGSGGVWSDWQVPVFVLALVGSHVCGLASESVSSHRCPLGGWAFMSFWVSLLMWVPLGVAVSSWFLR